MKFKLAPVCLLLLAVLALTACGGGGDSSSNPGAQSQPGETVINGKA